MGFQLSIGAVGYGHNQSEISANTVLDKINHIVNVFIAFFYV